MTSKVRAGSSLSSLASSVHRGGAAGTPRAYDMLPGDDWQRGTAPGCRFVLALGSSSSERRGLSRVTAFLLHPLLVRLLLSPFRGGSVRASFAHEP